MIVADRPDVSHVLKIVEAAGCDLIVMGTHGLTGLKHLLFGSLTEEEWHVQWTSHHLALDGWSMPLVVRDVFTAVEAVSHDGEPLTLETRRMIIVATR